jgi:hypothetical protein
MAAGSRGGGGGKVMGHAGGSTRGNVALGQASLRNTTGQEQRVIILILY